MSKGQMNAPHVNNPKLQIKDSILNPSLDKKFYYDVMNPEIF